MDDGDQKSVNVFQRENSEILRKKSSGTEEGNNFQEARSAITEFSGQFLGEGVLDGEGEGKCLW